MWRDAGVRRSHDELTEAVETIDAWCKYVLPAEFNTTAGWELQNMLTVSKVVVQSALARTESRGTHLRVDYPQTDPQWKRHLTTVLASANA